ncbi:MAG: nitrate/sulfonate/bicarbonate ABC transporter ATP-binding protein [Caldilineaceae bacterium]|nr:nitrate/sulfonate/bicarbonate ABC transporter ATP-binding protein [Caldilineaceae bacterium]
MTSRMTTPHAALIQATHIHKQFPLPEGAGTFTVLQDVDLAVHRGEIVALLGRSGSGKTTLLRIMAGLIQPDGGEIRNQGQKLQGHNLDVAMVFQNFALLPWETVLENVELGLKARGVPKAARVPEALKAIDLVGLDGFENAYPKELSGGMQQRVGFARALVIHPNVLFMDEPFSGLDVLTAENLRGEIADLWEQQLFPAESILIVTHNIEEAVFLADRLIIMSANPGRIRGELKVELSRPRNRQDSDFKALVDYVYHVMTNPALDVVGAPPVGENAVRFPPLPHARVGGMSGLLELLVDQGNRGDLPVLAERLRLDVDDLLTIVDAAALLGFATVAKGDVTVTPIGRQFALADILTAKDIFRQQVMAHVPFARTIYQTLQEKSDHSMRADFFLDILDELYPTEQALRQFETVVDWGRYAELFEYDAASQRLYLPAGPGDTPAL